jgi:hypothetical protein
MNLDILTFTQVFKPFDPLNSVLNMLTMTCVVSENSSEGDVYYKSFVFRISWTM